MTIKKRGRPPSKETGERSICIYKDKRTKQTYCFYQWVEDGKTKRKSKTISDKRKHIAKEEAIQQMICLKKKTEDRLGYVPQSFNNKKKQNTTINENDSINRKQSSIENFFDTKKFPYDSSNYFD